LKLAEFPVTWLAFTAGANMTVSNHAPRPGQIPEAKNRKETRVFLQAAYAGVNEQRLRKGRSELAAAPLSKCWRERGGQVSRWATVRAVGSRGVSPPEVRR
jgi:hypothetical protein